MDVLGICHKKIFKFIINKLHTFLKQLESSWSDKTTSSYPIFSEFLFLSWFLTTSTQ